MLDVIECGPRAAWAGRLALAGGAGGDVRSRARFTVLATMILGIVLNGVGCASSSPFNQSFIEIRTPNFQVTSSLGEARTRALARDLEVFHAGVLFAVGLDEEERVASPTRVIAFDGRGVSRPFAVRGAPAFLVPAIESPFLVIRSSGSFAARVDPDLRHRYAHRVMRDRSPRRPPLWYEEGRAQIAGSIDVEAGGVQVGRTVTENRRAILDWRRSDWQEVLGRSDLSEMSVAGRRRFDAQAWALVHTILFDSSRRREGAVLLDPIRRAFEGGQIGSLDQQVDALGTDDFLSTRIYAHLEKDRHRVDRMRVEGIRVGDFEVLRLPPSVARERLAALALSLDRPKLARQYFEFALAEDPNYAPALAGVVLAAIMEGDVQGFEALLERAEAVGSGNATASRRLGFALVVRSRAQVTDSRAVRAGLLKRARGYFERSLELEPGNSEAMVGLGETYLLKGVGGELARKWFELALRQSPGALGIDLHLARADWKIGLSSSATEKIAEVLSRSHSTDQRERARSLRDQIERESAR